MDLCFNLPSEGGYGLRRVEWRANLLNVPSINAALRLGFTNETPLPRGIKGHRVLLEGMKGSLEGREGDGAYEEGRWSRSTALLGVTYDEWVGEGGGRERLRGMLVR